MTTKRVFLGLAVVILTGTMAVAALADDQEMNLYGPAEPSMSSPPEQEAEPSDAGEIREPTATGALPDRPESSSGLTCCPDSGDPTFWHGGP